MDSLGNPFEQIKKDSDAIFRQKALTTKDEASQAAKGLGGPVAIWYDLDCFKNGYHKCTCLNEIYKY